MSDHLQKYRRALHRIPETDWQLHQTAAFLYTVLRRLPCSVFSPVGEAVCAYFDFGGKDAVAFRSDMDALPVTEQTGLPFASEHPGKMHACGHDGHMAILLVFAEQLALLTPRPQSNVLLIFEPAEETTGGAAAICDSGVLQKYHVSRIYGLHLWPELPARTVASRSGGMMSRSCELTVQIRGKSTHIAKWREGNDALLAAVEFVRRAYALAEDHPCLLRFGRLCSGSARNSLSDRSILEGTLRCFDDAIFSHLLHKLNELAQTVSEQTGCTLALQTSQGYPPVTNDALLLEQARKRFPILETEPTFITEDFSVYQKQVPGVFFFLGTGSDRPLHAPDFNFDEAVLRSGVALFHALL